MDLLITKRLIIPSKEIRWRFSRASGPGGQKVNKVESKVEIIFNIKKSKVLNDYQKNILMIKLKNKIVSNSVCLSVKEYRHQYQNRQLATLRLSSLVREALFKSCKLRKTTKPTKISQQKRIDLKKKRGQLKKIRKKEKFNHIL